MWDHMEWHGWDHHMFGWWGVLFVAIVLLVLVIGAVVVFIQSASDEQSRTARTEDTALDVLRRRYAEGEIDREEFEQKKRDLED